MYIYSKTAADFLPCNVQKTHARISTPPPRPRTHTYPTETAAAISHASPQHDESSLLPIRHVGEFVAAGIVVGAEETH